MSDIPRRSRPRSWGIALAFVLTASCGDELALPPATVPIARQQIHLFAMGGTPVGTPSGYDMVTLSEVQIFRTNNFDFVFDIGIDSTYGLGTAGDTIAVLLPRGYMGFPLEGGLIWSSVGFDSVLAAPTAGYEAEKPTRIRAGDTVLSASRSQQCNFGQVFPRYAKMQILSIDLVTRSVVIVVVIDTNCGYRSLGAGIPTF